MDYLVVNKRSGRSISEHSTALAAAKQIVKYGAWTRYEVKRTDDAELDGEDLHTINRTLYPALHEQT